MAARKCDHCPYVGDDEKDMTKFELPLLDRGGVRWYCPPCTAEALEHLRAGGAKVAKIEKPGDDGSPTDVIIH